MNDGLQDTHGVALAALQLLFDLWGRKVIDWNIDDVHGYTWWNTYQELPSGDFILEGAHDSCSGLIFHAASPSRLEL